MSFKNTREIYEALLNGTKLHCNQWSANCYVYFSENGFLIDEYGVRLEPDFLNLKEWEIYKEPKKKIKLYKFVYKTVTDIWRDSTGYFKDYKEFIDQCDFPANTEFIKKENDFIEVEE